SVWNNILVREPDAGKPPVRFDEREVETARTAAPLASTPPLVRPTDVESPEICIGNRTLATRYFLAPLAGYTHLAFRRVVRACGGVGLAAAVLVQAMHLVRGSKWARELVRTHPEDSPLSVQIYGGVTEHLVKAAHWLEE